MITTQTRTRLPGMTSGNCEETIRGGCRPVGRCPAHQGGGTDGRTGPIRVDSQNDGGHRLTFATPRALAPTPAGRAWTPMDALSRESQP